MPCPGKMLSKSRAIFHNFFFFSLQVEVLEQWTLFELEWKCGLTTLASSSEKEEETKEATPPFKRVEGKIILIQAKAARNKLHFFGFLVYFIKPKAWISQKNSPEKKIAACVASVLVRTNSFSAVWPRSRPKFRTCVWKSSSTLATQARKLRNRRLEKLRARSTNFKIRKHWILMV